MENQTTLTPQYSKFAQEAIEIYKSQLPNHHKQAREAKLKQEEEVISRYLDLFKEFKVEFPSLILNNPLSGEVELEGETGRMNSDAIIFDAPSKKLLNFTDRFEVKTKEDFGRFLCIRDGFEHDPWEKNLLDRLPEYELYKSEYQNPKEIKVGKEVVSFAFDSKDIVPAVEPHKYELLENALGSGPTEGFKYRGEKDMTTEEFENIKSEMRKCSVTEVL